MTKQHVELGDCLEVLRTLADNRIDSVVTDPPYELGFMGKKWDATGIAYSVDLWREVLRVLKPGGHLLAFGGTRTYHRMACAIEDAGFEIRDCIQWLYGTGFPKSLNIGDGLGTALKPANEPIVLARKPLEGTVAANVQRWGTGALNIDGGRIGTEIRFNAAAANKAGGNSLNMSTVGMPQHVPGRECIGRWPANVILDEAAADALDAQSGISRSSDHDRHNGAVKSVAKGADKSHDSFGFSDSGGASRFFYVAKPSRKERDTGCEHLPPRSAGEATDREEGTDGLNSPSSGAGRMGGARNHHPTVKPVQLMRYLIRLVTPSGGVVLDPFAGSGTTGMAAKLEGFNFFGIEKELDYHEIAKSRIARACADS